MFKNIVIPVYTINTNAIRSAIAYIWSSYTIPKTATMEGYISASDTSITVNVMHNATLIAQFICRPLDR